MNQSTDCHVQTSSGHYEKNNLKGGDFFSLGKNKKEKIRKVTLRGPHVLGLGIGTVGSQKPCDVQRRQYPLKGLTLRILCKRKCLVRRCSGFSSQFEEMADVCRGMLSG